MKGKETDMTNLRQILQRLREKQSIRSISSEIGTHRTIIRKMHNIAIKEEWLNPDKSMPSEEEIIIVWSNGKVEKESHVLDPYRGKIKEWHEDKQTATVMQRLLLELFETHVNEQVIRRYILKNIPKAIKVTMIRSTTPGKDADVDFGDLGVFEDDDGKLRKVYLFSLRLRHSRKAYRSLVLNQNSDTFNREHIFALEFFGGVMLYIHPDCTKAAVIQASIENDKLNRSYQSAAEHYGFMVSPCRPYTPEHKGGVEKDMDYIKRSFVAYFRAKQKELGIKIPKIRDLLIDFEKWKREVDDVHIIQGVGKTPNEIFFSEEKACLRPLPKTRWETVVWAQYKVRSDWRVLWDYGYYSVPYTLIGEQVDLCATSTTVKIFHKHVEVTLHGRCSKKWEFKRKSEHAPPFQEAVLQCTREGLLELAKEIGVYTHQYSEKILSTPGVDKLSPIRNMLRLAEKYSNEKLEKACQRACRFQLTTYGEVKNILTSKLESESLEENSTTKKTEEPPTKKFKYSRSREEYKRSSSWDEQEELAYPVSKYGSSLLGAYYSRLHDELIDELIIEEDLAVTEGRVGPLKGVKPKLSEAWCNYHNIPIPE